MPAIDETLPDAPGRLALWVTDTQSRWWELAQSLRAAGASVTVTRNADRALSHRVVVVYPLVSGRVLTAAELRSLGEHARGEGAVVAFGLLGGGVFPTFGVADPVESRQRKWLAFDAAAAGAAGHPAEDGRIILGKPDSARAVVGSIGFTPVGGQALARFDDGTAAIVRHESTGGGATYAIGIDVGDYLARAHEGRADGLTRHYVNDYDASADMLVDWLVSVWRRHEPLAVRIDAVPYGRDLPILITHDVDYGRSLTNARTYADAEAGWGIPATYFIQTKYVRDWNDDAFYGDAGAASVRDLARMPGVEIASHTVAHSRILRDAPIGSGDERFPTYRPFVKDAMHASGLTVSGEVRVSQFLLEQATGLPVGSFRPGHLSNPTSLPQVLAASGFTASSSTTANDSLTHRAFQLTQGRDGTAPVPVVEVPVTVEDEASPPLQDRLDRTLDLAEKVAHDRGVFVVLIHTNLVGAKLDFERRLVLAWKSRAWFGTIASYARYWMARQQVQVDVIDLPHANASADPAASMNARNPTSPSVPREPGYALVVEAPQPINGLSIELPPHWRFAADPTPWKRIGNSDRYVADQVVGRQEWKLWSGN